jgi:hypothetical protein
MIFGGQSQLELTINGAVFPMLSMPGLQCNISHNTKYPLPELRLVINDPVSAINTALPIVDGTSIGVILNDSSLINPTPVTFRAFGTPKRIPMPGQPQQTAYVINALLNAVPLVRSNPNTVHTGTSNSVIQNIASANGLNFSSNVAANDSMTWLPGKKTWAGYINHIANHAYIDDTSAISWGIDEAGTLHYNNIVPLFSAKPVAYIYYGAPPNSTTNSQMTAANTFTALQYQAVNRSGMFNSLGGYGQRTVQPTLSGGVSKYLAANATVTNNSLDISSNISSAVKPVSRMSLAAADAGNAHPNYIAARHQNHRLKCTYTQNIYVLLYRTTGLKIFDTINFTATTNSSSTASLVNGTYLVTGVSRVLWSNRYFEKLELVNAGPIPATGSGLLS